MASDAQIRGNRDNSKKSTGPRTQAGKDQSRFNAATHNITGTLSLRTGPEKEAFDAFFVRLIPDFEAQSDLELEIAARAIDALFRLARISTLEGNIFAAEAAAATASPGAAASRIAHAISEARAFMKESRTFSNLSLYEQRLSRTLHNSLATLRQLQAPQRQKGAPQHRPITMRWVDDAGQDTLPPISVVKRPAAPVTVPDPQIGFVFSNPQPHPAPHPVAA